MTCDIITIVGARPQFIKASVVSRALLASGVSESIIHTGQHYDTSMSDVFFEQLEVPPPRYRLNHGGGSHGRMTGRMLEAIEEIVQKVSPRRVLVYGDTNSTLAGALAAAKLHVPVAHVEAGLRSFDRRMPEELNRILTDQLSDLLFCPSDVALANLVAEGIGTGRDTTAVIRTGDIMEDVARLFAERAIRPQGFEHDSGYILATVHRAENTDDPRRLDAILEGLSRLHAKRPVVLVLHPRTRNVLRRIGSDPKLHIIEPVGYFEMMWLLTHAGLVATDSGGLQKEAFFHGRHCITLREVTEWTELINQGVNVLVGADPNAIEREGLARLDRIAEDPSMLYGGGTAAEEIAARLVLG